MRIFCGLALALVFGAGLVEAETVQVSVPPKVVVEPLPTAKLARPVTLTRLAANIPSGTPWRQDLQSPYFMMPCVRTTEVHQWTEQDNKVGSLDVFERIFREELVAAGFRIGRDPTNLFEEQTGSDLQVGALITTLRMKTCEFISPLRGSYGGSAAMDVQWQVYSVSRGKIVARVETHGGFELKGTKDGDSSAILRGAFADGVRRLAADQTFRNIVTAVDAPAPPPPVALAYVPAVASPSIAGAVKSVVSIYAGEGMGSGVLISPEGYILTNHHVAGESGKVRLRWADGVETTGDVLRSDARRDVALIRAEPKAAPLAIRHTPVQLGETVYAIGTPLRKEFANTLTRGVVSGTRLIDGLAMIQSDAAVDHGNSGGPLVDDQGRIVALTVSAYSPDDVGHNINFFIPIDDALKALGLSAAATPTQPLARPKVASRK
jgi:serine protease Do